MRSSGWWVVFYWILVCLLWPALGHSDEPPGALLPKQVRVIAPPSGQTFNHKTGVSKVKIILRNRSKPKQVFYDSLALAVISINRPDVALLDASGTTPQGHPYRMIPLPKGLMRPRQVVKSTVLRFSNPNHRKFRAKFAVYGLTAPNHAPTANAGPDRTVFVGDTATLDGSGSTDPDGHSLVYHWTLLDKPTHSDALLTSAEGPQTAFAIDVPGVYKAQLVVDDRIANSVPDVVTISTQNSPPVANAGQNQTAFVTQTVALDGGGSTDIDGDPLSFHWNLLSTPDGSKAALSDVTQVKPTFQVDKPGTYTAQLVVNDGKADGAPATVNVSTQNSPPVANAGQNQTVLVTRTVTLDGGGSTDVDGDSLTYRWNLLSTPVGSKAALSDAAQVKPTFQVDKPGTYAVQLVVNDGKADGAPATVNVSTQNSPPVANAGQNQTVFVTDTVRFNGSGSTDVDGDPLTYRWSLTHPPGSGAALSGSTLFNPTFVADKPGTYVGQLIVNDGKVDGAPATVSVSTRNSPPVAHAGPDQTAFVGDTAHLDGAGSKDVDGDPLSYRWALLSAPTGSAATLRDAAALQPDFVLDQPGNYVLQLIVNDGAADSPPDTLTVTTRNSPPVAHAGPDQIVLIGDTITLDGGQSSDADHNALTFRWALLSRPSGSAAALADPNAASCPFSPDLPGDYVAQLIVNDGTVDSLPDTATLNVRLNQAPRIDSTPVIAATAGLAYHYAAHATDPDGNTLSYALTQFPAGMAIDPATGTIQWTPATGQIGDQATTVRVTDGKGGEAVQRFFITVRAPVTVPPLVGLTRAVAEATLQQAQLALGTLGFQHHPSIADGIVLGQGVEAGTQAAIGTAVALSVSLGPDNGLPTNPVTVAPVVDPTVATTLADSAKFLYGGTDPVQTGVAPGTIEAKRTAVIRGKVLDRDNKPLPGVTVTLKDHPEFGQTLSRSDGQFDLAVNGGSMMTLNYRKAGFLPVQRQVDAHWQEYAVADDVVMIPLDSRVTTIDLAAATPMQVARGNPVTDQDGTRQATLMIPQGTKAQVYNADGTLRETTTLNLRLTEYTVGTNGPATMPSPLPPTSAYTYAVELRADEGAVKKNGKDTVFDRPVPFYVDNFLNFPAGTVVPVGYYDADKKAWVPHDNGVVIQILSITGGLADVDSDGDKAADDAAKLAALGMTDAERQQLAATYPAGKSLWRARVTHLSTWDCNWPFSPPSDAEPPNPEEGGNPDGGQGDWGGPGGEPTTGNSNDPDDPHSECGSIIGCETQSLGENLVLTGVPFRLHYASDRVPGSTAGNSIRIPLSGATLPASLKRMELRIEIAGRTFTESLPATASYTHVMQWDGQDAYGRQVNGTQSALISIGFTYDGAYQKTTRFGYNGNGISITGDRSRAEVTLRKNKQLNVGHFINTAGIGAWDFEIHHAYDPIGKTLYLGNGAQRKNQPALQRVIRAMAGAAYDCGWCNSQNFGGDGGPAKDATLEIPYDVAVAPDGSYAISDSFNNRIRRVDPDGTMSTLSGNGQKEHSGDGGPAVDAGMTQPYGIDYDKDGNLYTGGSFRVRRISPDGIITTVAGNGSTEYGGDGGPALDAGMIVNDVKAAPDGSLYIVDNHRHRIRRISPDGIIDVVAGSGDAGFSGDGGQATAAQLNTPLKIAIDPKGGVYFSDSKNHRVRHIDTAGIITTVAGNGSAGSSGDGGPATKAQLNLPCGVALARNGELYITEFDGHRVRRVRTDGTIDTFAGNGQGTFGGNDGPAVNASLRHPTAVAFSNEGHVIIVDRYNNTVRKISPVLPDFADTDILIPSEDGGEIYLFDSRGRHLATRDAVTGALVYQFGYDGAGNLSQVTDGDGNRTAIERDGAGNPLAVVSPYGQRTQLTLDGNGHLASARNPANETFRMTYTADGLLKEFRNPADHPSTLNYDTLGRLVSDRNAAGGSQSPIRAKSSLGYQVERTTGENRKTLYTVENLPSGDRNRIVTAPDGTRTTTLSQLDGSIVVTQPDGATTSKTQGPDPRFGMAVAIPATREFKTGGQTATIGTQRTATLSNPDDPLSLTTLTDTVTVNGHPFSSAYDAATKTVLNTSAANRVSKTLLDNHGRVVKAQVTGLLAVNNAYDPKGRLSSVIQGTGADQRSLNLAYNDQGYLQTITDALNRRVNFEYDPAGRVTKQILPGNREVRYGYDLNGNLASLTPPGQPPHIFKHTPVDQAQEYAPPDVGAGGNSTLYEYDLDKALKKITRPDGLAIDFGYNTTTGKLEKLTTPDGDTAYAYDTATGKLKTITAPDGGTLGYGYNGALLTETAWTGAVNGKVGYGYDNDFRINSVSLNDANPIAYGYDDDSLLTQAGSLALSRSVQNGLLTGSTLGKVADALGYNDFGEVSTYTAKINGTAFFKIDFTRDKLGRITRKVETLGVTRNTYDYGYDAAGRLHEVKLNNVVTSSYDYDDNGNRLTRTQGATTTQGSYDAQDRLKTYGNASYAYTDDGELKTKTANGQTTGYTYDLLGNLRKVNLPDTRNLEYLVDGQNRRIGKKINGKLVQGFLWQSQLKPLAELNKNGKLVSRFVYATHANVPDYMVKGGKTYRLITDHLGSPRFVVNTADGSIAQQMDYDEFGNVTQDTNPGFQPFGFAGGLYDRDTGLIRFGARDYDAETGRWLAKDPIGLSGGLNVYGYVENNPVSRVDRLGLYDINDFIIDAVTAWAGFSDEVTLGASNWARNQLGTNDVYDKCSIAYNAGEWAGEGALLYGGAWGAKALWKAGLDGGVNSVFWSGYSQGARGIAEGLGTTLESTPIGKTLDFIQHDLGVNLPDSLWRSASRTFAENASGTASAVIRSESATSIWSTIEERTLMGRGIPIIHH